MEKLIAQINKIINKKNNLEEVFASFSDKRYKAVKIDISNFKKIKKIENDKKIAFIDGGNAEVINGGSYSVHFIRLYCCIYSNNKRIKSKRIEFYSLVNAVNLDGKIKYKTNLVFLDKELKMNENNLLFDSFDKTISEGNHRVSISKIGEIVRRFAEVVFCNELIDDLGEGDVIVRDGSLQSSVTNENMFFNEIYEKLNEKKIIFCGLSKSCSLYCNNGETLVNYLGKFDVDEEWYYYPIVEIEHPDHKAEIYFVKLHSRSKYIFRFEVFREVDYVIEDVLSLLLENSKDAVFLGYPYGLIEADRFARVGNNEVEYLRTIIKSKLGKDILDDAHSVLDSVG